MARRITFAYAQEGWSFEDGEQQDLKQNAQRVIPVEYTLDMKGNLFCPVCYTNLIRSPKENNHFSDGREACFAHMSKYQDIKCSLRSLRARGKQYANLEEAQQAIDDENLVIVHTFLQDIPEEPVGVAAQEFDETPLEDKNGPLTDVPIARHNGQSFILPSKITTVAGICRNFDRNYYKYFHFPAQQNAFLLSELLHDVTEVSKENESRLLYFGVITSTFSAANNPGPENIRMTKLESNDNIPDFYLKAPEQTCTRKGITDESTGRIVVMYGQITANGVGLCIERPAWGEFALLPKQYSHLLL